MAQHDLAVQLVASVAQDPLSIHDTTHDSTHEHLDAVVKKENASLASDQHKLMVTPNCCEQRLGPAKHEAGRAAHWHAYSHKTNSPIVQPAQAKVPCSEDDDQTCQGQ